MSFILRSSLYIYCNEKKHTYSCPDSSKIESCVVDDSDCVFQCLMAQTPLADQDKLQNHVSSADD